LSVSETQKPAHSVRFPLATLFEFFAEKSSLSTWVRPVFRCVYDCLHGIQYICGCHWWLCGCIFVFEGGKQFQVLSPVTHFCVSPAIPALCATSMKPLRRLVDIYTVFFIWWCRCVLPGMSCVEKCVVVFSCCTGMGHVPSFHAILCLRCCLLLAFCCCILTAAQGTSCDRVWRVVDVVDQMLVLQPTLSLCA
jgi:hypothetical protein